nr:phospholipase [Siminovitchia fordii]
MTRPLPFQIHALLHILYNKGVFVLARIHQRKRGLCLFPGYKWCGPGCSGPEGPINDVDACCMRHDICLKRGIHPCLCDERFIECLLTKCDSNTSKGRIATIMYIFMRIKASSFCWGYRR